MPANKKIYIRRFLQKIFENTLIIHTFIILQTYQLSFPQLVSINTAGYGTVSIFQVNDICIYRVGPDHIHVWLLQDIKSNTQAGSEDAIAPVLTNPIINAPVLQFAHDQQTGDFAYLDDTGKVHIVDVLSGSTETLQNSERVTTASNIAITNKYLIVSKNGCGSGSSSGSTNSCPFASISFYLVTDLANQVKKIQLTNKFDGNIRISHCKSEISGPSQQQIIFLIVWDPQKNQGVQLIQLKDSVAGLQKQSFNLDSQSSVFTSQDLKEVSWSSDCKVMLFVYRNREEQSEIIIQQSQDLSNFSVLKNDEFTLDTLRSFIIGDNNEILARTLSNDGEIKLNQINDNFKSINNDESERKKVGIVEFSQNKMGLNTMSKRSSLFYGVYSSSFHIRRLECFFAIESTHTFCSQHYHDQISGIYWTKWACRFLQILCMVSLCLIIFAKCTPLIKFCLRFINYWVICSLYAMFQLRYYPKMLYQELFMVYQMVNTLLLQLVGLSILHSQIFQDNVFSNEKITGVKRSEFGLTSNVLSILVDPLTLLAILTTFLLVYKLMINKLLAKTKKTSIRQQTNTFFIYVCNFISYSTDFSLAAFFLAQDISQQHIGDKTNIACLILLISATITAPFMIFFTNQDFVNFNKKKKRIQSKVIKSMIPAQTLFQMNNHNNDQNQPLSNAKKIKKIQESADFKRIEIIGKNKVKKIIRKYLKEFHLAMVNLIFPILINLNNNQIAFIVVGNIFFLVGVWVVCADKNSSKNQVVLALQFQIFHLLFCCIIILDEGWVILGQDQNYASDLLGEITILVFLIGGLHEGITFLFMLGSQIRSFIQKKILIYFSRENKIKDLSLTRESQGKYFTRENKIKDLSLTVESMEYPPKKKIMAFPKRFKKSMRFKNIIIDSPHQNQIEQIEQSKSNPKIEKAKFIKSCASFELLDNPSTEFIKNKKQKMLKNIKQKKKIKSNFLQITQTSK